MQPRERGLGQELGPVGVIAEEPVLMKRVELERGRVGQSLVRGEVNLGAGESFGWVGRSLQEPQCQIPQLALQW